MRTHYALLSFVLLACSSASEASPTSTDPACPAGDAGVTAGAIQLQAGAWKECWYTGTKLDFVNEKTLEIDGDQVTIRGKASDYHAWVGTFDASDGSLRLTNSDNYEPGHSGVITGIVAPSGRRIVGSRQGFGPDGGSSTPTPEIFFVPDGETTCPDHP